jgi:hypothetical protein
MTKSRNINRPKHRWTSEQLELLRALYPDTPTKDIAARFNVSLDLVYRAAKRMGVDKSAEYLASPAACRLRRGDQVGKAFRFPKGHVPANKGQRRPGYSPGRMRETQFKKGEMSGAAQHNYVPIGTLRISRDGDLERKVTDDPKLVPARRWVFVRRLVWEAAHGPIPAGHVVRFKDGTRTAVESEITLDKLECIAFVENMRRNTLYRYPKEIVSAIKTLGHMRRRIRTKERKANEKQNDRSAESPVQHARGAAGSGQADGTRTRKGNRRRRADIDQLGQG